MIYQDFTTVENPPLSLNGRYRFEMNHSLLKLTPLTRLKAFVGVHEVFRVENESIPPVRLGLLPKPAKMRPNTHKS